LPEDEYEITDQRAREAERIWEAEMEERASRACPHREYRDGHCAEMSCPNYIMKHMH